MTYLVGIDIGTSSVKSLILQAESAHTLATAICEYPIHKPHIGHAEQDPDDWWNAAAQTTRQALQESGVDPASIRAVGLSGQMHGTVCLNTAMRPVRPAIIWADSRSTAEVADLLGRASPVDLAHRAPGWPATGFMATTLMWLARHEPETLRDTQTVILPKDYVRMRMTGSLQTDTSDAASTWLLDTSTGKWSEWLLELCGLEPHYLPPVVGSAEVVGGLTPEAARDLGLLQGTPVVAGCADQPAQALGYGLADPGTALVTIGTGGQVLHPLKAPRSDPQMRAYVLNHAVPDRWYAMAAILVAGLALRWLRDTLGLTGHPDAYRHLSELAAEAPAGADGLLFVPHLLGNRSPQVGARASGAFTGLKLHHGVSHLARAVMEGVAYGMAECIAVVKGLSEEELPLQVVASGGATRSALWLQIQADVYNTPLMLVEGENHACIGAALLAGVGSGVYGSFQEACARLPQPTTAAIPNPADASRYREGFAHYQSIRSTLETLSGHG